MAKENVADINITIERFRYIAFYNISTIITCKSFCLTQRKFIVCVVDKVRRFVQNTSISRIYLENVQEFKMYDRSRAKASEALRSVEIS
jgi:hypothetical protein